MPRKKSQIDVLGAFRAVHGNRYDYSSVNYVNSATKVIVVCRVHGEFLITYGHHVKGVGCRKCYFKSLRQSKENFVLEAREKFGDKYDYGLFNELPPVGGKIPIRCKGHNQVFEQDTRNHLRGHAGCPECKSLKLSATGQGLQPGSTADNIRNNFIRRATEVHGGAYGYEQFQYTGAVKKGAIVCRVHGVFQQSPNNHLSGSGCPKCAVIPRQKNTFKKKCETLGVDYWRALKRSEAGMSDEAIFNKGYVRHSRKTKPITVHGVIYPNLEEASRALQPPASTVTIARWLASDISPEESFTRVPNPGYANGSVYLITHINSGMQYVGITVQSIHRRWKYHIEQSKSGCIKNESSLHAAIRKFGGAAFSIEIIDYGDSKSSLEKKEREWIKRLNTQVPSGFNISPGGTSGGSNARPTMVYGQRFASVHAAAEYISQTRKISLYAAKRRLLNDRIDVRTPAPPGKSLVKTPAYKAWSRIVHGVLNPNSKSFVDGVTMYEPWRDFKQFFADVGQPDSRGMAFARLDKSKGFSPDNCAWMTKSQASKINAAYMKLHGLLVGRRRKVAD